MRRGVDGERLRALLDLRPGLAGRGGREGRSPEAEERAFALLGGEDVFAAVRGHDTGFEPRRFDPGDGVVGVADGRRTRGLVAPQVAASAGALVGDVEGAVGLIDSDAAGVGERADARSRAGDLANLLTGRRPHRY